MPLIKQIEIAGFRGILSPLPLSFEKGGKQQSMVIHGRNGHGKSSVTDSWEWFQTGNIERLNREDAGHGAFPHRQCASSIGATYVSLTLADGSEYRLTFNHKTITKPIAVGDVDGFRRNVPHPCHLRHDDLTRFVYKTKAEQYDALAHLMGFEPQVAYQKTLGRIARQFKQRCDTQRGLCTRLRSELAAQLLGSADLEAAVLTRLKELLSQHGFNAVLTIADARAAIPTLTAQVTTDTRAQQLAEVTGLHGTITSCRGPNDLQSECAVFTASLREFLSQERALSDLALVSLFERGQEVLKGKADLPLACPLCGQSFTGDLFDHIATELGTLKALKAQRDNLESTRASLAASLAAHTALAGTIKTAAQQNPALAELALLTPMEEAAKVLDLRVSALQQLLATPLSDIDTETPSRIETSALALSRSITSYTGYRTSSLDLLAARKAELGSDAQRAQLVADHSACNGLLSRWDNVIKEEALVLRMEAILRDLERIADDYSSASNSSVAERFATISADVARYFSILEVHAQSLANPGLRLIEDKERAVTLEIEFLGEMISPAYKYLSESQLNSFGLALFLASARHFNGAFKFLILDDVVNSFDAHKRPQVVELLKSEFHDFQLLILTHDEVWSERLFRAFPGWVRTRFTRFDSEIGPVIGDGLSDLEKIERDLLDDEPGRAGQLLGQLLERELQELCETCEASLTFNRRNEYTLQPLMIGLRERLKNKLSASHPAFAATKALEDELGFRNWCAHWKNPSSPVTKEEVQIVVDKWKAVMATMQCNEARCGEYVKYDKKNSFVCRCGTLKMTKSSG